MGLADIEKRIIDDANASAAQLIEIAKQEQARRYAEYAEKLKSDADVLLKKLAEDAVSTLDHKKQWVALESKKEILKKKREILNQLIAEIQEDILRQPVWLASYFDQTLRAAATEFRHEKTLTLEISASHAELLAQALKKLPLSATIASHPDWESGRFEIALPFCRVDCSLATTLHDTTTSIEGALATALFEE